jgi:hypothetical protein
VADYAAIRAGLATRLEAVTATTFLTVHDTVPGAVTAPAAVVVPSRPIATYHETMTGSAGALAMFRFELVVMLQSMTEEFSQNALDALISGTGSVPDAVEADPTLGGAAITCQVTQATDYGVLQWADTEYVGARFMVEVHAR